MAERQRIGFVFQTAMGYKVVDSLAEASRWWDKVSVDSWVAKHADMYLGDELIPEGEAASTWVVAVYRLK